MTITHSNRLKLTTTLVACAAPFLLAATLPGSAALADQTGSASNQTQVQGYIGPVAKNAFTKSIWDRLNSTDIDDLGSTRDRIVFWHSALLDSVAIDHTPDFDTGEVPFIQGGPTRTSRALAMTQLAVYDAIAAFDDDMNQFNENVGPAPDGASVDAAISYAAHAVLVALFPNQQPRLDVLLAGDIRQIAGSRREINRGRRLGQRAARIMLRSRRNDNSDDPEPNFGEGGRVADGATTFFGTPVNGGTTLVGEWEPDPNTPEFSGDFNLSLGAFWGGVTPFAIESGDAFRIPPPPPPGSRDFNRAFRQVARRGGSPENVNTPSTGTPRTRFIGNFWGYDAVPLLGTPPRLYNQIAVQVALANDVDASELSRLLAMVNVGQADSGIAAWDAKWFYNYWRPVTGIRRDDGVAQTDNDADWDPVGVSIVNVELPAGEDFIRPTPPFPSYPSGHATFGAAMFEVLRAEFGDDQGFTFISDEYNGQGVDPIDPSVPRPLVPRRFDNFTDGQEENGISRIFNGVHWNYDNIEGQALGVEIGRFVTQEFAVFRDDEVDDDNDDDDDDDDDEDDDN